MKTQALKTIAVQVLGFVILVAVFVGFLMREQPKQITQAPKESTQQPSTTSQNLPPVTQSASSTSKAKPLHKMVVQNIKVLSNRNSGPSEAAPVDYDVSKYLMKGYDGLFADPDNVRTILESTLSDKSKTLLLSGIALIDTQNSVTLEETIQLAKSYYAEVSKNPDEFFRATKGLLYNHSAVPDKIGDDLFKLVMNITPTDDADFNSYANDRIKKLSISEDKNDLSNMSNAIYASVMTSPDEKTGWATVGKLIDRSKPQQAMAFDQAKMLMSYKKVVK